MINNNHGLLVRIVRLTLRTEEIEDFLVLFDSVKLDIRSFEGCKHLELLQDTKYPNIVTTYSLWTDESALNAYRNSRLFKDTWRKTKKKFAASPFAFSSHQVHVSP